MAGNIPIKDDITLTRGADFVASYDKAASDPDIPLAATARIEITAGTDTTEPILTTWTGSVAANSVSFRTESEDCDDIEAGTHYRLILSYPGTPTLEHCWYYGRVKRVQ